jgi:two-component system, sensor histidine kinase
LPDKIRPQQPQEIKVTIPASAIISRVHRVLIVDDNEDSAESMMMLARSWGHEVAVANDGPVALTLALTFQPDIAMVDIGLPGMDGYEVARRLRKASSDRDLYLMALTGYGRADDVRLAREAGFDEHLIKPTNLDELRRMLESDTAGRRGTRQAAAAGSR